MREKIIEIIGFMMERERAECKADEILKLFDEEYYKIKMAEQYYCNGCGALNEEECVCGDDDEEYQSIF